MKSQRKITNKFLEPVAKFKYLGKTLKNSNFFHEDITN